MRRRPSPSGHCGSLGVSKYACSNTDCTVAVTDKCLLSHVPIETCPNVQLGVIAESEPPPGKNADVTTVFHGNELGFQQASVLLAARYGHLIGVLGAYGTGKTCLLSSMYLLASCGELRPTFLFAGSATLPGFEGRLRLLRKWSGTGLPDQIMDHTVMADPRQPGLLHLGLLQTKPVRVLRNFFFTDLPGEWTTDLIKHIDAAERLRFLRRADALVIALPAPLLLAVESRNSQVQLGRMLLQRLREAVGIDRGLPVIFAITRCDQTGPEVPPAVYKVVEAARDLGFPNVSHLPVAAFSDRRDVPSGLGVASLLETLVQGVPQDFPQPSRVRRGSRMFARYQVSQGGTV